MESASPMSRGGNIDSRSCAQPSGAQPRTPVRGVRSNDDLDVRADGTLEKSRLTTRKLRASEILCARLGWDI